MRRLGPLENPVVAAQFEALAAKRITQRSYPGILEQARQHATGSIMAASIMITDADDSFEKPSEKIQAATEIAETVKGWQTFIDKNPDAPVFAATEYDLIVMKNRELALALGSKGTDVVVEAPFQECASMNGGKLRYIQGSIIRDGQSTGGYSYFNIELGHIREGIRSPVGYTIPPMITGTQGIAQLFDAIAEKESAEGLTENRLRSLPYMLWLMRGQSAELAEELDVRANTYGHKEVWAEQCQAHMGASIALILKRVGARPSAKALNNYSGSLFMTTSGHLDREIDALKIDKDSLTKATLEQCRRLGISTTAQCAALAIDTVAGKYFESE